MAMFNSYVANYQRVTFIVEIYIGSYQPSGWCQSLSVSKSWWSKVAEHKRICQAGYQRNWSVVYLPLWKIWKSVGIILLNIWKKNVPNHQPGKTPAFLIKHRTYPVMPSVSALFWGRFRSPSVSQNLLGVVSGRFQLPCFYHHHCRCDQHG